MRPSQIEALQDARFELYVNRMVKELAARFEGQCAELDGSAIRSRVVSGIDQGREYSIRDKLDITRFLEYTFELGDDFINTNWASSVLEDDDLTGTEKMDRIDDLATFKVRIK